MNISSREYQIAELIAWGASDKEVAQELNITPLTARTHRRTVEHKIGAYNAADLTRWFFQDKHKLSFGLNPRQIRHIAMMLFLLITFAEISQLPIIRIRASRGARTEKTESIRCRIRSSRARRNEYILA